MSEKPSYEKRIEIPEDCDVVLDGRTVRVTGPKGTLERTFPEPLINIRIDGNQLVAWTPRSRKRTRAMVGTIIAHVRNMIVGVQDGYTYEMKIVYSHFPITVEVQGKEVIIKNFIGERGVRRARIIGDVEVKTTEDDIIISGLNIEEVAQTAANIQLATKIRDKDRRVFLDGIYVIRKRKGKVVKSIV